MKLTLLRENLKIGLRNVSRCTLKSAAYPILENILLETEKNFLTLSATNLEMGIKYWILAKVEEEGGLALPFNLISNIIENIEEDVILLSQVGLNLKIKGKEFIATIKGQEKEDFPIIPDVKFKEEYVEMKTETLVDSLEKLINIPTVSLSRPEISGIYFNFSKNKVFLVATDSFRLAEKSFDLKFQIEKERSFILPLKAAKEIINIFKNEEKVFIYFSENQIFFQSEYEELKHPKILFVSRLVEGEYPDYKEIIPKNFQTIILLPQKKFLRILKSATIFSGKSNEVKLKIDPKEKKLKIQTQDPKLGEFQSEIESEIKGKEIEITFNIKFLIDGISEIDSEKVIFEITDSENPAILKPSDKEDYFYIIMPIKAL